MKLWIVGSIAGTLLIQSPAFAIVADKFKCSIQLFEPGDVPGPKSVSELAVVRVPEAADPNWVPGVSAASGNATITLEASDVKVSYLLSYKLFHSVSAARASQAPCFGGAILRPNDGDAVFYCFSSLPDTQPYDPTYHHGKTSLSSSGTPLFRSQDLRPFDMPIENIKPWSRAHAECEYLGTFE